MFEPALWRVRNAVLSAKDHTLVMGIVNTTPDSFSDGGRYDSVPAAVAAGLEMRRCGADIVDVGGESTRPGAVPVSPSLESKRVVPVVAALHAEGVIVSVDTRNSEVAAAAIEAGAAIVNDVSGFGDPDMAAVCAASHVGVVIMHMQGSPQTMQLEPHYDDVVADIRRYLLDRVEHAVASGIGEAALCVDPGIGFGKTLEHNLELLSHLGRFAETGRPVLVGASRKGFLGAINEAAGRATRPEDRDAATAATTALAIAQGASVVRVHDVPTTVQAARTADAIVRAAHRRQVWSETWPG